MMAKPSGGVAGHEAPVDGEVLWSPALRHPHVLKRDDCFAVLDPLGDAQATGAAAEGLFFEDTRYLSRMALAIDGKRPALLSSAVSADNASFVADLANPDLEARGGERLPHCSIHLLRSTSLDGDALRAAIELQNFHDVAASFRLSIDFDADFRDIFELRGTERAQRGERLADEVTADGAILGYVGRDRAIRRTRLAFSPKPDTTERRRALWEIRLPAGGRQIVAMTARCERDPRAASRNADTASLAAKTPRENHRDHGASLISSNGSLNDLITRSRADLDLLVTDTPQGPYAYAGIPWFSTPFGRDGLITALECLWLDPTIAAGTLRFLAAHQATAVDERAAAEPGKILHEARKGEMAVLCEVPFRHYYGSIDATPLFVVLAAAYYARTGDIDFVRSLWPNIEAALAWMAEYGDADGDGFLEYDGRSGAGLTNQGWKDSGDAVFHADGRFAEAPIALSEVQSYAFAAYLGGAELAAALGQTERAASLAADAEGLRARFEDAFWLEDLGTYALALDGAKRPCRVRTSNAGQVLFGGIASAERAASVAKVLMAPPSFSRWGIRTVAEGEARYNPMSYHNGSVWPHDNGVIAMGLGRYGFRRPLVEILTGLCDAAHFMEVHRLPELFCGFARRVGLGPTAHPAACAPQAWSAASVFATLGALLGVSFDAARRRIRLERPTLPCWIDTLRLSNLRLGAAAVDL
ncbi:MAG TPA: amylo-alpha-1,6-glucosidase, partial [Stellaceae bacterium]|nr:amylo-alpha-1,6-glucosidase [Stellaceae bacterium]